MHKYLKYRDRIQHLSKHEQLKLLCAYYRGENINILIQKYNIDISIHNFHLTLYLAKTAKAICPYCKKNMYCVPPSKSKKYKKEYFCKSCWHIEGTYNCICQNCIAKKQAIAFEKKQKQQILQRFKGNKNTHTLDNDKSIDISTLSIKEKAYLGALLRVAPSARNCTFRLHNVELQSFAPSARYSKKIIDSLLASGIIFEMFFSTKGIDFALNIQNICSDDKLLLDLMYPQNLSSMTDSEQEELLELIREVQIYEAIEYFLHLSLNTFSLTNIKQGDIEHHFYRLFNIILDSGYSTSQLFYFIYSSLRNFAANNNCMISDKKVYSSIYRNMLNLWNKAYQEQWDIKKYNRIYSTKPSELFKLITTNLLNIGDDLFYEEYKT